MFVLSHIREELSALHSDLSEQYLVDSKAALSKMAELKEVALRQAEEGWQQQRKALAKRVSSA